MSQSHLSATLALLLCATLCTPTRSSLANDRTINQRLTPVWTSDTEFTFRKESASGSSRTVNVNALTGEMTDSDADSAAESDLRGGPPLRSQSSVDETNVRFENHSDQPVKLFWVDSSGRSTLYHELRPGQQQSQHTYIGHAWKVIGKNGDYFGSVRARANAVIRIETRFPSPPEKQTRPRRENDAAPPKHVRLKRGDDGKQWRFRNRRNDGGWIDLEMGDLTDCELSEPRWSPDQTVVAFWKIGRAPAKEVHVIESSPKDGGRARLRSQGYRLPGDPMDRYELLLFRAGDGERVELDVPAIDFGRPRIRWSGKHDLLIQKVDRGHQRFRLFRIDPIMGTVQSLIDEQAETFVWTMNRPSLRLLTFLDKTEEAIYASERSGWQHLYLVDLTGERPMRAITSGKWVVRELLHVDESARTVDLLVSGIHADQDPYHRHLVRAPLDEGEPIVCTDGDGDHRVDFSPDRKHAVVTFSRVDHPPVHQLRRMSDGKLVQELVKARRIVQKLSYSDLPRVFHCKGRDGETDIWGYICFPEGYRPGSDRKYPVIESIYAGPHDSHVAKSYRHAARFQELTSLGFFVVSIDGMGTANRSKAFHDVCWHNLKDAGFPDRIAWMKAAAEEIPAMDLGRVGIYGTSAGGQNACGALLFHGDFYRAAYASCGCHDNRMDKRSWNEQWMGFPVGEHYAESSNIDNAHRLNGDLFLAVGELDQNVPPESTYRLVDALIRAGKDFEFLLIPGMGHSDGGSYGRRRMREFFVEKLITSPQASGTKPSRHTQESG